MIRRDGGSASSQVRNGWILISQVDHAHVAADLAEAWGNDRIPRLPLPERLLPAIRDHDEGWREWERLPDLDPETHWPRNFTEMPPAEAMRIWTHSIETCRKGRQSIVATVDEFRRFLALAGMRLTHDRAIIAEEVFSSREAFSADDLCERLPSRDDGRRVSRSSVSRTLSLMEEARLLRKVSMGTYRDAYEQTRKIGQGSALGGLWVSKHFTFLANRIRSHHPGEESVVSEFLDRQHHLQNHWAAEIAKEHGPLESRPLIEQGFHWVQFFDLLSLWLCCQQRTETEAFEMPTGESIHFTPLKSGEIAIEPFPLSVPALTLEIDARRIPKKAFPDRAAFQAAYEQAKRERLTWKFVRW